MPLPIDELASLHGKSSELAFYVVIRCLKGSVVSVARSIALAVLISF